MMNSIIIEGYVKTEPMISYKGDNNREFSFILQCDDIVRLNNKHKVKNNLKIKVIPSDEIIDNIIPFIKAGQKIRVLGEVFPEKKTRKLSVLAVRIQKR